MQPTRRSSSQRRRGRKKRIPAEMYTIAWFCVTDEEKLLARACLDEQHAVPELLFPVGYHTYGEIFGDQEHDTHNIIIIQAVESGKVGMGTASAHSSLKPSFRNLELAFVVGIAAGLPTGEHDKDIYKGDVVVATPANRKDAVVEYDYADAHGDHELRQKRHADKTALQLRGCFARWYEEYLEDQQPVHDILESLVERDVSFAAPASDDDVLFLPEQECLNSNDRVRDCTRCRAEYKGYRERATSRLEEGYYPLTVHKGMVVTGSSLIRSARMREERISKNFPTALCVDMESAVLMDTWHPLIVRGISDYADSHYDWKWVHYASATASAVAKSIIQTLQVPAFIATQNSHSAIHARRSSAPAVSSSNVRSSPPEALPGSSSLDHNNARISSNGHNTHESPSSAVNRSRGGNMTTEFARTTARSSTESEARGDSSANSVTTSMSAMREPNQGRDASLTSASSRSMAESAGSGPSEQQRQLFRCSEIERWKDQAIRLIQSDADVNIRMVDEHGSTLLHYAVRHESTELARLLLTREPSLASEMDGLGRNPLHSLCATNLTKHFLAHARLLLGVEGESRLDPNAKDGLHRRGKTALEYIIAKHPSELAKSMLKLLLDAGATWPESVMTTYGDYVRIRDNHRLWSQP